MSEKSRILPVVFPFEQQTWFQLLDSEIINAKVLLRNSRRQLAFPPKVLSEAWVRSMAACECRLADHQHAVPCGVSLRLASRGVEGEGVWEAHHVVPESDGGGSDKLDNCAIVCWSCHSRTL